MYWFREGNPLAVAPWLLVMAAGWLGGWLIATHAFHLDKRERLVTGLGIGLVGSLWFSNLLGHWLPPFLAFSLAGVLLLGAGMAFAWRGPRPLFCWEDLQAWPQLVTGLALAAWFVSVGKGLSIFDEPKNLTIISNMAAGDIPPHFYLNSSFYFRYHYGFQLLGSILMRLAGLFPWSAFDLAKGIVFGLCILLAYLTGRRYILHPLGGVVTAVIVALASGTRYLLLFLPSALLQKADASVPLIGTSAYMAAPFSQSLVKGWTLDGGPPFPFLFAFLNGIFPPLTLAHAGSVALSFAILALLLLLTPRLRHPLAFLVLAVLLAAWGLVWESSYGLFAIGGVLVSLYLFWKWGEGARGFLKQEPLALMASVPLVLLQGGTITEIVRKVIFGASDSGIGVEGSVASTGFSLRWPPALLSSHFGPLNVFSPVELAIAFFELGPILLLTPWITWWAWKRLRNGDWVVGALVASAWVGFIFPLFLEYQAERDISRLTGHSMLVWTLFLAIMLWEHAAGWQSYLRYAGAVTLALMVFGGVVTTGIEFTAAYPPSLLGYELSGLDARIAKDHWDRLPEDAEVFDAGWWRASALTGRLTRVSIGGRAPIPTWDSLRKTPSVEQILANGYRYVYVDELWWGGLPAESQLSLSSPCIKVLGEYYDQEKERFRRLLDLEACKSQ